MTFQKLSPNLVAVEIAKKEGCMLSQGFLLLEVRSNASCLILLYLCQTASTW